MSHRKGRRTPASAATARTAVTIAVAGAVSATGFTENGQAAARPTPEQVRSQVDKLFQQAAAATRKYDGARATADRSHMRLDGLQDRLARRTQQAGTTRDQLGWLAADRYRTGGEDPTLRLILASSPGRFLERAVMQERADATEAAALRKLTPQESAERQTAAVTQAAVTQAAPATQPHITQAALVTEPHLTQAAPVTQPPGTSTGTAPPLSAAPSFRAAAAVAFAYAQLGKPCLWGATGPSAFDCSGLTQAAWAAAGVSLPRTTYRQINTGTRVSESQLQPGDLVFYYAGISHVGIHVGHGQIIHAPHPGADVRVAPVNGMPFAGAIRPA